MQKNVQTEVKGQVLTIRIDLSKKGAPSSTGKTMLVASTGGGIDVGGVKLALNAYRPLPK